jgi:hypothetical protein
MGLWYQVKSANASTFCQQGLALVTFTLRDSFKDIVTAQGVSKLFFANESAYLNVAASCDIEKYKISALWSDPVYGLNNSDHFQVWVAAALNRSSGDYKIIKSYFGLSVR